jgi:GNAT superfamily N-acetyltransferase
VEAGGAAGPCLEVREMPIGALAEYAGVPIMFEVRSVLEVEIRGEGSGPVALAERAVGTPWTKDYDAVPGEGPEGWPDRFDLSRWGLLAARASGRRVGGAAVAIRTPGLDMLEGRDDLAVLWDIRVAPEARGRGVGTALLRAAEAWARARGCRRMKVETQNINVPACRFYAKHGFRLSGASPSAYAAFPEEIQLLWDKGLGPGA